jgi:hypothetical protein
MQVESEDDNDTSSDESDVEVISIVDETDNIPILTNDHSDLDDDEEYNSHEEEARKTTEQHNRILTRTQNKRLYSICGKKINLVNV